MSEPLLVDFVTLIGIGDFCPEKALSNLLIRTGLAIGGLVTMIGACCCGNGFDVAAITGVRPAIKSDSIKSSLLIYLKSSKGIRGHWEPVNGLTNLAF